MTRTMIVAALSLFTIFPATAAGPREQDRRDKTYPAEKGGALVVRIGGGSIEIRSWDRNEVAVRVDNGGDEAEDAVSVKQQGSTILIESGPDGVSNDMRLEVTVPARFDLHLSTNAGDIGIEGPLTGSLTGNTSGGDIRIGDVGGTVKMTTSGGDIVTGNIQGDLWLNTSGGNIHLGAVSGDADVSTSGGEIEIRSAGKRLTAKTSGGNVTIGDVGSDATASTAGGDISIGTASGSATLNTAGGNVTLRGATGTVRASTSGGDLLLENITGSVDGNTAGGNITATLAPGNSGKSRLTTAAGDIHLFVPDKTRATINAQIQIHRWHRDREKKYDIQSDFPSSTFTKENSGDEIRATYLLNGGGQEIILRTTNGNITIRKAQP